MIRRISLFRRRTISKVGCDMVTGRTRPKKYALTSAHRALRPKILFEVLHIIIKKLVLFLYDGGWVVPRSSLLYSRSPRCTWRRCLEEVHQLQRASKRDQYLFIVTGFSPLYLRCCRCPIGTTIPISPGPAIVSM